MISWKKLTLRYRLAVGGLLCILLLFTGKMLASEGVAEEPLVRICVLHKGASLPDGFFLYQQLTARGIAIKSITPEQGMMVIHLGSEEQRLAAKKALKQLLPDSYNSA